MIAYLLNISEKNFAGKKLSARAEEKIRRFQSSGNAERATQCAFADLLIAHAAKLRGIENFELNETPSGKPHIEGDPFYFSVAHCKNLVVLAVHENNVGADCELLRATNEKTVAECLNEAEKVTYNEKPTEADKIKYFFRCYTEKESYVKFTGTGFSSMPRNIKSYPGCKFVTKYVFSGGDVFCLTFCAADFDGLKFQTVNPDVL